MARHVIAVGAGKGGVGKSTVALHLALALRQSGVTGILDFDLYGPNIPALLGIEHTSWTEAWVLARKRAPDGRRPFRPVERDGLHIVSTGFILGEDQHMGFDPATAQLLTRQLMRDVAWPALDFLVVDLPPGTSPVQHVLARELKLGGAIIVVTPQAVAHMDARKAVQMFRALNVRVLGGVENMTGFHCTNCGYDHTLFDPAPAQKTIWAMDVEQLASLPFLTDVANADGDWKGTFSLLADRVVERLR